VWKTPWKKDLIDQIINGGLIPPIRLVAKNDEESEWEVLDGKQRIGAILDFINDKFKIKIDKNNYSFSDIRNIAKEKQNNKYKQFGGIYNKFVDYSLGAEKYPNITYAERYAIFERVNHTKSLRPDEVFIGEYIYLKLYCEYLCSKVIKTWYFRSGVKNLNNGKNISCIFKLLAGLFSLTTTSIIPDINKMPTTRSKALAKFAKEIDGKIKKHMDNNNLSFYFFERKEDIEKMYKEHDWNIKEMFLFIDEIGRFFNNENEKCKKEHATMYFTMFLTEKFYKKQLNKSILHTHNKEIQNIWNEYIGWISIKDKDTDAKSRRAAEDRGRIVHLEKLNELWTLDDGIKGQSPTKKERSAIFKKANYTCEICGKNKKQLENLNLHLEIDHVIPISYSSKAIYGCLCNECNRKKQDNTSNDLVKIAEYIDKKKNECI
jgi:hypothetical protein